MGVKSDIEIAQEAKLENITEVAAKVGILEDELELYGKYKAKLSDDVMKRFSDKPDGKLVLVTAINPTPAGEGKTTISIGLTEGLNKMGVKAVAALREPSLGPCFGIKGGAAGGGYAQVVPMEDLNLHFTGDFHAITAANNLLAAMLDNHIMHGNELHIDTKRVVASEIMAILCLAEDMADLKERLGKIIVAYNTEGNPVTAQDLKATGSMAALLKDAMKPNMIQTLENTPVLVHGGPFANIAHGCNSVRATKLALKLGDVAVTEAGFGADLGAEKFMDIKCRLAGLKPDAVVLVATIRALKYNGGVSKEQLGEENIEALEKGIVNLDKHIENIQKYGVPVVVTLNQFITDTDKEYSFVKRHCEEKGCEFAIAKVWAKGGEGGLELAKKVMDTLSVKESNFKPIYEDTLSITEKIEKIAKEIYGADGVEYSDAAKNELEHITKMGYAHFPVCMAKTQYSLSDNANLLGRPQGFKITVREVYVNAGAGFVVAITGKILTMPGLPKSPAAERIDYNEEENRIVGLF